MQVQQADIRRHAFGPPPGFDRGRAGHGRQACNPDPPSVEHSRLATTAGSVTGARASGGRSSTRICQRTPSLTRAHGGALGLQYEHGLVR